MNRIKQMISAVLAVFLLLMLFPGAVSAGTERVTHIKIVLDTQGGTGGASELYVEPGGQMPDIIPPTRRGYAFQGYYTAASGKGDRYYDETGRNLCTNSFTDTSALYAFWKARTYTITYENMDGAVFGPNFPRTHTYGLHTVVSDPTKADYTFFGWQVGDSSIASCGLTLGANAYDGDIVLTAVWNRAALVTTVHNTTETVTMLDDDLREVFQRQVTDPSMGVTAIDLNSEEVQLTMTADDRDELAEGAADIISLAQGEVLKFYDFSVKKTVTKLGEDPVTMPLNELPNTVQVEIMLGSSLRDRSSYRVYRYHNGQAEPIPMGPVTDASKQKESFELSADGSTLILHTRRLSTYAVTGGQRTIGGTGSLEEGSAGVDVQAQVMEGGDGPVYKVDIVWGPMRFTYSTGRKWDPDEHRYTNVQIYDWIPEKCYTGGNNKITVYNHSNADVSVGFAVFPIMKEGVDESLMDGVEMVVSSENKAGLIAAADIFLQKVPSEGADAPSISGYLRLNGSPDNPEFYKGLDTDAEGYVNVADIAVTITHLDGPRTPKTNP